jgi:hypothetical protein
MEHIQNAFKENFEFAFYVLISSDRQTQLFETFKQIRSALHLFNRQLNLFTKLWDKMREFI